MVRGCELYIMRDVLDTSNDLPYSYKSKGTWVRNIKLRIELNFQTSKPTNQGKSADCLTSETKSQKSLKKLPIQN